ncbi:hypothetical protein GCM10007877_12630 [Marinibactrum halimedae]|uniref:LPS-assembly lipoprotein LptE n=2 Tax=Marinibactrum halimedae TaxID=1444977 RepID=A0AA37WL23_9GAMM|nr:hypothetical protein GCM10007877_12630 [Marinibactrum halimedae]
MLAFILNACGWHLRGSIALPSDLRNLSVINNGVSSALDAEFSKALKQNNIERVSPTEASYTITVSDEYDNRRTLSVGTSGLATQYELTLEITYGITKADGTILVEPEPLRMNRNYDFDQQNIAGKAQEEQLLRETMRRELVQQVMRRFRYALLGSSTQSSESSSPNTQPPQTESLDTPN